MGLPVRRIRLRRGERRRLERLVNKRTTPQRVVERANIVLCSAEGRSGSAICREVGVSRPTVTQWLDRYEAGGVEELLEDRPRSGRPRKITPDDEAEIVRKTLEEKPADATHWSCRLMAKEVGVHPTTISRIWRAHGLQPHRIEYFKLSTDPPERAVVHVTARRHSLLPSTSSTSSCPLILTSLKSCATWWVSTSIPRSGPLSSLSTRRARSKPSTAPSQVFPSRRGALEP